MLQCRTPFETLQPQSERDRLPEEFSWQAYLKWNPELEANGIHDQESAERHFLTVGKSQNLVYKDFDLTLRYTACGGLMNQQYCHISALAIAHLAHAKNVIWPPMQERTSFSKRYHTNAAMNEQSWLYLDANTLWDIPAIQKSFKGMSHRCTRISMRISTNASDAKVSYLVWTARYSWRCAILFHHGALAGVSAGSCQ
jgi:hypothetical protein